MKRILAAVISLTLLCPAALAAEPEEFWMREEGDGSYVTIRVPCPQGEGVGWAEQQWLSVRYADTKQPVPLTSDYTEGYLFATVPAADAERPLECFRGEEHRFPDCITVWQGREYYNEPGGARELSLRGVIRGDAAGNLNAGAVLTRAEAFALVCRMAGLLPEEDEGELWAGWYYANGASTGYEDVDVSDWFFPTAVTARYHGLAASGTQFCPDRAVTRGEFTVLLARAMEQVGWLTIPEEGTAADLSLADAAELPAWALGAYQAFGAVSGSLGIFTARDTEETGVDGYPVEEYLAEWDKPVTREEAIGFLETVRSQLPWYPTQAAIEWGFDRTMPVLDGSTSTYPYTEAVYDTLFWNHDRHPQFPGSHSTSHTSYERLIRGEVDVLFAATLPSEDLKAQAKAAGVELECVPIAYDAMVFFTNVENAVTGLTRQQIQDIYVRGRYDNWNQVGGPDAALLPYRRNVDSGSHALMEQYFLEGGKLSLSPDVHNVLTSYAMSSALSDVAAALRTDPPAYALGYSVYYYYLSNQHMMIDVTENQIKLLAVDGVLPSAETIADGSYPLSGYNYAVLSADEPANSPARRMAEFMVSEAGQSCVRGAGFGALSEDPQADFEQQNPGWTVRACFPVGSGGYGLLARDDTDGTLRGSYLTRNQNGWGEFLRTECPAAAEKTLSAAVLKGTDWTLVFGQVGGERWDGLRVCLTLADGERVSREVSPGGDFRILLEGTPGLKELELLQGGAVLDRYTEFG